MTGERVLVVEDNAKNLKLVKDVLEYAGYEVVVAETGERALELVTEVTPDLVLMDLQLPGMDGTETMRRLRQLPKTKPVPVVAVTAFAMQADRDKAFVNGFDGFIEKPISVRALPGQIERFLTEERQSWT
jgi:two-component system cell cycle response regulator DivK